jgi:hypothetical protein
MDHGSYEAGLQIEAARNSPHSSKTDPGAGKANTSICTVSWFLRDDLFCLHILSDSLICQKDDEDDRASIVSMGSDSTNGPFFWYRVVSKFAPKARNCQTATVGSPPGS